MIETLKTFFNKLLGLPTDSDSKNNKGKIEFNLGRFESALIYFTEALKTAEGLKDMRGMATSLNNIGLVYQDWGKPEQALEYYQKALEIDEEPKEKNGNGAILLRDRNRWEIVQDLLKVTKEENKAKKTRIMQRANLDWRNFQRHFGFLLEEGLIENCDSNCYELTKKGEELIRRLDQVDEILNRKVTNRKVTNNYSRVEKCQK